MPYMAGVGLALGVCLFATFVGFDRDRAFYPTLTMVIASYYALFAVLGGGLSTLGGESVVILLFLFLSVLGFRVDLWVVVAALCGHAFFDLFHAHLITNPGVPMWWPGFCLTYDVTAGGYLALLLSRSTVAARSR